MKRTLKKCCCAVATILLATATLHAETITSEIPLKKGEHWWGVFLNSEHPMPLDDPFTQVDLSDPTGGYLRPLLLSSQGRYIWSDTPFKVAFDGATFRIESERRVEAVEAGKSLREAYLVSCHKHPKQVTPTKPLVAGVVYDLCSEFGFQPSAEQVLEYANRIKTSDMPTGTLLLPAGWQRSIGVFEPSVELYGDMRGLVEQLQGQGFKVMLSVTPHVSADGEVYRQLRKRGAFLSSPQNTLSFDEWEGGWSALYDLSDTEIYEGIATRLNHLRSECAVDGFRFDMQGALPYLDQAKSGAQSYLSAWSGLAQGSEINHYTVSRGAGAAPYVRCWSMPEDFTWEQMSQFCAELIQTSLLTECYATMEARRTDFFELAKHDPKKFLRYAQLLTVLPVMNLPCSPWSIENTEVAASYRATLRTRALFESYFKELVEHSATTLEPLIRHLEYEFPKQGFNDCNDQFMVGSKYLVAPVMSSEPYRTVRLPRGAWRDASGKRFRGPIVISVPASDERVLYFERVVK